MASAQNHNRRVDPGIAPTAPGVSLAARASPLVQIADGVWNHGEGFKGGAIDRGAWFDDLDDGTTLVSGNVHTWSNWTPYTWTDPLLYPSTPFTMDRFVGYLRPTPALPTVHPLYGSVGTIGPVPGYVDSGAFELFKPPTGPSPTQKILVCVFARETTVFPKNHQDRRLGWYQTYPGIFSPDGLERNEILGARSLANFVANTSPDTVLRPSLMLLPAWAASQYTSDFWPILVCATLSVMHRPTTLNEQRYLQMVQAVKLLLQEQTSRNPLGAAGWLTPTQAEDRVVVCFVGGSNGGLQGSNAVLRHPKLVHGCFSEVFSPCMDRFYGEHESGHALSRLIGGGFIGAGVAGPDFLHWNQYMWSQGVEAHDASFLRLFTAGRVYRPACFSVGDEDVTSTGIDWVRVVDGSQWSPFGKRTIGTPFGSSPAVSMAWMVAPDACHQFSVAPVTNPYTSAGPNYQSFAIALDLFQEAKVHREQMQAAGYVPPASPLAHVPRTQAQQLRGLDDPYEWFLGRLGEDMPTPNPATDPLVRDTTFFGAAQPSTAGTSPGHREAMRIHGNALYVGSADGLVSKFEVDSDPAMKQRLKRVEQSRRLGHEVSGLVVAGDRLVVATRRHLRKLRLDTLAVDGAEVLIPFELAEPHHLAFDEVLSSNPGPELVFASTHGGLVFYDANLNFLHHWTEPGIFDFRIHGGTVSILSARNVVANVTFNTQNEARLEAVTQSIPAQLRTYGAVPEPPGQGGTWDLELMALNWTGIGFGVPIAAVSTWLGDEDGFAVRWHSHTGLNPITSITVDPPPPTTMLPLPDMWADLATCTEAVVPGGNDEVGDHLLVLTAGSKLRLYDQYGNLLGTKVLTTFTDGTATGSRYYPFANAAHTMCVGELVANTGAYQEEIVVATNTGLVWLHVQDLVGNADTRLPATATAQGTWASGYWLDTVPATPVGTNCQVQPRTNQTLASAWAVARRPLGGAPAFDNELHVLDQHGAYWKVDYAGNVRLQAANGAAVGARGWRHVGSINGLSSTFTQPLPVSPSRVVVFPGSNAAIQTVSWRPLQSSLVVLEQGPSGTPYVRYNWALSGNTAAVFDGFLIDQYGGSLVPTTTGWEAWAWRGWGGTGKFGEWGDMVEGLEISSSGIVTGTWASTQEPTGGQDPLNPGHWDRCPFHHLRSYFNGNAIMNQQSAQAIKLAGANYVNQTAVVLGCPGGSVRVLRPGVWRTDHGVHHGLGSVDSSTDQGLAGGALAVRHDLVVGTDRVAIWLGTVVHPTPRPTQYADDGGTLADHEVATGAVVRMEWSPATGFSYPLPPKLLSPTWAEPRGGYGVIGLCETDLNHWQGRELLVTTMSGDLFVLDADTLQEKWRTRVDGAIGCYNSIVVANLNGDSRDEVYIAGSKGLWRFTQQGETVTP